MIFLKWSRLRLTWWFEYLMSNSDFDYNMVFVATLHFTPVNDKAIQTSL